MGLQAMNTAATGMEAFQFNLDTIANNLANAGTTAFKRARTNFEDVYYDYVNLPGGLDNNGKSNPVGIFTGLGTKVQGVEMDFSTATILETGAKLDMAIIGDGFFQVQDGNQILYTRAGNFTVNEQGEIVLASATRGRLLEPSLTVPQGTTDISITSDGNVYALTPPSTTLDQIGQIQTVSFLNPQGLVHRGENLFQVGPAAGNPQIGTPGLEGRGTLRQGYLEQSNVEPVRELIDLIKTQRNFELNSQVVQAADQLLQLTANMRRF